MTNKIFTLLIGALSLTAYARPHHDDVFISACTDNYKFTTHGNTPVVENSTETEYTLNSAVNQKIQPGVYYGEFISLDYAKCGSCKAAYKSVTPENVFYDDTKVCFFNDELWRKHPKATTKFRRTFKDIHYFTRIYLSEDYLVKNKTVTITIPTKLKGYRLVERNFNGHISTHRAKVGEDSVFTYTVTDLPAERDEDNMPPFGTIYPHIVVVGPFADYHALYRWSRDMADVDCTVPDIKTLVADITRGCKTDEERIAATYAWVQQNIRYVAFEAGVAGHRPDRPAEVIRKRYGDCKGMALLLRTLLREQGFDARLTDIGTTSIPYRMSDLPTLAAANHVICTLLHGGKTYYLDATYSYIPYDYVPLHIQGQQAMIENGDDCLLATVPSLPAETSVDKLTYRYRLVAGNRLEGEATYELCGDMKEYFLTSYHTAEQGDKEAFLANNLNADNHSNTVTQVAWKQNSPWEKWAVLTGQVTNANAVQTIDNECYIELNPHNNLFIAKIDTTDRVNDFCLPQPCNVIRQVELTIPAGYRITHLPADFKTTVPQGTLSCSFARRGTNKVVFTQRMQISNKRIARNDIPRWNEAVSQWTDACNDQLILKK